MSVSAWDAVAIGEFGISFIALQIIWLVAVVFVRRRKDPLRLPFLWLKWAIPLFILYVALNEAATIIDTVNKATNDPDNESIQLIEAATRIFDVASLISSIADMFLLLCFIELALSFLRALGNDSPYYRFISYSNYVFIALLFVLAIAAMGANENYVTKTLDQYDETSWTTVGNLYSAYTILYWITSIGVIVLSSFVLHFSLRKKHFLSLTSRLFAASLLNLTRSTWELSYAINYEIDWDPWFTYVPQYVEILDPILYTFVTVSIFGLLMAIGFKKQNGLWSEQQLPPPQQFASQGTGGGVVSGMAPAWKQEVAGAGPPGHWTQYPQQQSFILNQHPNQNPIYAPAFMHALPPPYGVPAASAHGAQIS